MRQRGKPIEGAEVVLGYSHHAQIKNYDDYHSFNSGLEEDNGRKMPPGQYDFKLKKKSN